MKTTSPSTAKTTVFNLIILDESGSMESVCEQTISGCNETLATVRAATAANPDKLHSLVSIYAFQSGAGEPSRYLVKNANPNEVKNITSKDYIPLGCTPLLDAVGSTMSELMTVAATHEDATAIVTIITDGEENSSRQYSWQQVARIISQAKELGWTINLIGANIDVDAMASKINIDNRMAFTADDEDVNRMFGDFNDCSQKRYSAISDEDFSLSKEEKIKLRKMNSKDFFKNNNTSSRNKF